MHQARKSELLSRVPPEGQLLLCCARTRMDEANAARMRELVQQPLDWGLFHRLTFASGLIAAVDTHLNGLGAETVPADTRECLRKLAAESRRYDAWQRETLSHLLRCLEEKGIPALPFLESAFSFLMPLERGLRGCSWVDFLVRPQDASAARAAMLNDANWKEPIRPLPDAADMAKRGCFWLSGKARNIGVSFHWAAAPWRLAVQFEMEQVWKRATQATVDGRRLACPSPEDLLLLSCIQSTERLWAHTLPVWDVAELLSSEAELDWEYVLRRAEQTGILRMLFLGLFLARELLQAPLPAAVANRMAADQAVAKLAAEVCDALFAPGPEPLRTPQTLRFHFRVRKRRRDRVRYLWRFLVTPTEADWKAAALPQGLAFLYPGIRLARLAWATVQWLLRRQAVFEPQGPRSFSGYSPSRTEIVDRMLELAEVGPQDLVYDLGCGDGRIVIRAAQRFGARGVGVDLDPERIRESQANAAKENVEHLVTFLQQDAVSLDLSPATVVTLYLPTRANLRLAPKLMRELRPGTRVISHDGDVGVWDKVVVCNTEGPPAVLYLWRIPREAPWQHAER